MSCLVCDRCDDLVDVTVGNGTRPLCRAHHATLGTDGDRAFADEAELLAHPALDRRTGDVRRADDRRMFPRPEGRRLGLDRRGGDPGV